MGATIRHGPHQGAHRSTRTRELVAVTAAKSASVASTSQGTSPLHFAQRGRPLAAVGTRFFAPQEGQAAMVDVLGVALTPPVCPMSRSEVIRATSQADASLP